MIIEGIKLIEHNAAGMHETDDLSYPYKLEVFMRPPEFMSFAFVCMHGGSERIVVRGKTREALDEFIRVNRLKSHPRLSNMIIVGPEEGVEGDL